MNDRITCFKLHWYDCELSSEKCIVQEEIVVYRNDNYLAYKELNRYGVICSCRIIHLAKENADEFFGFLEQISDEWAENYKAEACGRSAWKMRMWHSSHKIKKVCGTVNHPPHGKTVEKYIRSFIMDRDEDIAPMMFGCGG